MDCVGSVFRPDVSFVCKLPSPSEEIFALKLSSPRVVVECSLPQEDVLREQYCLHDGYSVTYH